ncbi:MAG: Nif3-like dinuclear metal center hexameric protein [Clostridiales bacterium]|jgi:dinuclear metal center YbgI/SA1388 family protein|nr:Nif3-like dinuclear metal center hexameric protein [Clostridiales bacterium]
MAIVSQVMELLQTIAPLDLATKYGHDNVGLLIGHSQSRVDRAMLALDVTQQVLKEAVKQRVQLIICHHPIIFKSLHLTDLSSSGKLTLDIIKNNISVYSAHTNLDFVKDGINDYIALILGLKDIEPLQEYTPGGHGLGRVGSISTASAMEFAKSIGVKLKDNLVSIIGEKSKKISRVAVINGAGGGDTNSIDWAMSKHADCLVTAEVKHHVAIYAKENDFVLIECQHYCMEHPYIEVLCAKLNSLSVQNALGVFFLQALSETNLRQSIFD